jgi:hypothetical protein
MKIIMPGSIIRQTITSYLPGYNLRFKEKVPLSDLSILLWLVQPSKDPVNRTSEAGLDHTI